MKTKITLILGLTILFAAVCGNLSAQSTPTGKVTTTSTNVMEAPANQDILVVTGRIIDADSKQPIKNAKINFNKFGEELLHASIDDDGNYSIVLNKKELGEPIRIVFKIAGYKRFVLKSVAKSTTHLSADVFLAAEDEHVKSNANVKFVLDDSPFNTTVIKMQ